MVYVYCTEFIFITASATKTGNHCKIVFGYRFTCDLALATAASGICRPKINLGTLSLCTSGEILSKCIHFNLRAGVAQRQLLRCPLACVPTNEASRGIEEPCTGRLELPEYMPLPTAGRERDSYLGPMMVPTRTKTVTPKSMPRYRAQMLCKMSKKRLLAF